MRISFKASSCGMRQSMLLLLLYFAKQQIVTMYSDKTIIIVAFHKSLYSGEIVRYDLTAR